MGQVVVAAGDLCAGGRNAVGTLANLVHHASPGLVPTGKRLDQITKFITTRRVDLHAEVTLSDAGRQRIDLQQRLKNRANQPGCPENPLLLAAV